MESIYTSDCSISKLLRSLLVVVASFLLVSALMFSGNAKAQQLEENNVHQQFSLHQAEIDTLAFTNFADGLLPDGWSEVSESDDGRRWVIGEPNPVRQSPTEDDPLAQIGTGYTLIDNFGSSVAIAEGLGTFSSQINMFVFIETPEIQVNNGDDLLVRFTQNFRFSGTAADDNRGEIQLSLDGESWQPVYTTPKANVGTFTGTPSALPGVITFPYTDITGVDTEIDITEQVGGAESFYLRFVYSNGASNRGFWWIIDNLLVYEADLTIGPARDPVPANDSEQVRINTSLNWTDSFGIQPSGYFVSLGTDLPPSSVAELVDVGTETFFTPESELDYSATYYWQVFPYDEGGNITSAELPVWSFTTKADPVVTEFPFVEQFDDVVTPAVPLSWRTVDANETGQTWRSTSFLSFVGENSVRVEQNSSTPKDDWLFSPPLELEPGNTYEVSFWYTRAEFIAPVIEKMKVHLATGTSPELVFDLPVFNDDQITSQEFIRGSGTFTVEEGGRYFLGWHAYSDAAQRNLYLDDITVSIVPPDPIAVLSTSGLDFADLFIGEEQTLGFSVRNEGAEDLVVQLSVADDQNFELSQELLQVPYNFEQQVSIAFSPVETGTLNTIIALETNDPSQPQILIEVSAEAFPPPIAEIDPETITLTIIRGVSDTRTLSIGNSGESELLFSLTSQPDALQQERVMQSKTSYQSELNLQSMIDLSRTHPVKSVSATDITSFSNSENSREFNTDQSSALASGITLEDPVVVQDSLFYDAPGLDAGILLGIPNPEIPFWGATRFTAGDTGFYLTHIRNWVQQSVAGPPTLVQIYKGGEEPEEGELILQQSITFPVSNGNSYIIPLESSFFFEPDEEFWVVFRFPVVLDSPQGGDSGLSGENVDRFRYWLSGAQEWAELPNEDWAYKVRAINAGIDWISFEELTGNVAPGHLQAVNIGFDATELEPGFYEAFINVFTNDPQARSLQVPVELTVIEMDDAAVVQVVHNAADPFLNEVDIYKNGSLWHQSVEFRTATPYLAIPAGSNSFSIHLAGSDETLFTQETDLEAQQQYQLFVNGLSNPDSFNPNPDGLETELEILVFEGALSSTDEPGKTALAFTHGITDAPSVRFLIEDFSDPFLDTVFPYGSADGYVFTPAATYNLLMLDAGTNQEVSRFILALDGLEEQAYTVMASGFIEPPDDTEHRADGLFLVSADGQVIALETATHFPGDAGTDLPADFKLAQNYPNPFNPSTQIQFSLPEATGVRLRVFDITGRLVAELINEHRAAGVHQVRFDGSSFASGMYIYQLEAGFFSSTRKMLLIK
ncbi:MAG: DUF4397 domain-containing protein [Balneolales bacterium]|nr:DUF4397 domain-containing protein [Balneolales bacterium]